MRLSATRVLATALVTCGLTCSSVLAQTTVTWDGGNGTFADAKWNGGQTGSTVFNGSIRLGNGQYKITIGGGSDVTYVAGPAGGAVGTEPIDRRSMSPRGAIDLVTRVITETTINVNGGSRLYLTTDEDGDADGEWSTFDIDLNLDNGTLKRDYQAGGNAQAGGIAMFGSWNSRDKQTIDINLWNGGKIENDGQLWFGADEEHAEELTVHMNINNGTVDLTGGAFPVSNNSNLVSADLAFFYGLDDSFNDSKGLEGDGASKNEDYRINFRGTGSLTVDADGAWVYRKTGGSWVGGVKTFEELWNEGILRNNGVTGGYLTDPSDIATRVATGRAFANFFTVTGTPGAANYSVSPKALTTVTWDGGTGEWNDNALWNGGQTAVALMGANSGVNNRGSDGGHEVVIDGSKPGGADVSFDPNPITGANTDFRMRVDNGHSAMTIKNGGKFTLTTASDDDGKWTRWGSDLNIDGAGSLLKRAKDGVESFSGGALMFGAFNQQYNQEIDVNITNGGKLENDGELYFGQDGGGNSKGLTVTVTINGGSMDLYGGDAIQGGFGVGVGTNGYESGIIGLSGIADFSPSLMFHYGYRTSQNGSGPIGPSGENYVINFTGAGSITVDHAGIYKIVEEETGFSPAVLSRTYQQLWDDGILRANGLSGLTGANFNDYFTVAGSLFADGYKLTSKLGGLSGDYNADGKVDAADYVMWRNNPGDFGGAGGYNTWRANFGAGAGSGSGLGAAAVPEPTGLVLFLLGLAAFGFRRRSA